MQERLDIYEATRRPARAKRCWVCEDGPAAGTVGYSSGLVEVPAFAHPVPVCGNCLLRALRTKERRHVYGLSAAAAVLRAQDAGQVIATAIEST